ncbi:hypothetical protein Dsin_009526 [Dipteronia sinensis]|uniref:SWIM-type domain-containing protein n=1 Tax=Dipteronia sinensis TaxID=43782 RepID=A0AAE0EBU0_9ROSI|nr:hypothetical protein Dsin_009526 [Dipteronia sinensis]
MTELKETYRKVYDELISVGVEKFSRVHSPKKRYFLMTTNIAELMNSCLLAVRKLPITVMAEFIRDLLQRTETAHQCEIHLIHFNTFKVDEKWKETTIDLDERSCSCRQWDVDELSCSHAMAVARFEGVSINALASEFYTTGFLKHAYEMGVNPFSDPEYWDIPDVIRTRTVLPCHVIIWLKPGMLQAWEPLEDDYIVFVDKEIDQSHLEDTSSNITDLDLLANIKNLEKQRDEALKAVKEKDDLIKTQVDEFVETSQRFMCEKNEIVKRYVEVERLVFEHKEIISKMKVREQVYIEEIDIAKQAIKVLVNGSINMKSSMNLAQP